MAVLSARFELGSNGATIASTDPGDSNAWDNVFIAASSTLTYDNTHAAHGALAAKVNGVGGSAADFKWLAASVGTVTDHYGRMYAYLTANPAAFFDLLKPESAGTVGCYISVISTGQIAVADSLGANALTTTASIGLNQWVRIEYHLIHSTTVGQVEIKIFNSPESQTATETATSAANKNLLASIDQLVYGARGGQTAGAYWMDDIVGNATSYPGPYASNVPARRDRQQLAALLQM